MKSKKFEKKKFIIAIIKSYGRNKKNNDENKKEKIYLL